MQYKVEREFSIIEFVYRIGYKFILDENTFKYRTLDLFPTTNLKKIF